MADIKNIAKWYYSDLRNWLEHQSPELRAAFAARAALRAMPTLAESLTQPNAQSVIILPSFYAMATALSASHWSDSAGVLNAAAVSDAAAAAYAADFTAASGATAAAAYAADAVADADIAAAAAAAAAADAAYAAYAYASHATPADAATHAAWRNDIQIYARDKSVKALLRQPLWPDQIIPEWYEGEWIQLKTGLSGDDWSVWTDWYEQILEGDYPFIEEIDIGDPENSQFGRVTFAPEMYNKPKELNAALRKIIDDYWAGQTRQDNSAETFEVNDDGKIQSTSQSQGLGLTINPEQQEWYTELREAVASALQKSPNELGAAKGPLEKLSNALPEDMRKARVPRLWRSANNIRRTWEAHNAVKDRQDYSPDKLETATAHAIEDVSETFNNLKAGDPVLLKKDENAPNPKDVEAILKENGLLSELISEALEKNAVEDEARETLAEMVASTEQGLSDSASYVDRLAAVELQKDHRNLGRALIGHLRTVGKYVKGLPGKMADRTVTTTLTGILVAGSGTFLTWMTSVYPSLVVWAKNILTLLL